MEKFEVDLDTESIWFDDAWHTRDALSKEIKEKLEAGDYQIAKPSQAIEFLTQSISQMRVLAVRVSAEMAEALDAAGQETGRSINAVIRQLVDAWLSQDFDEGDVLEGEAIDETDGTPEAVKSAPNSIEEAAEQLASESAADHPSEDTASDSNESLESNWFSTNNGGSKKKKK